MCWKGLDHQRSMPLEANPSGIRSKQSIHQSVMPSETLYWAAEGLEPCSSVLGIINYLYLLCGSAEGRDCNSYRCIFKLDKLPLSAADAAS